MSRRASGGSGAARAGLFPESASSAAGKDVAISSIACDAWQALIDGEAKLLKRILSSHPQLIFQQAEECIDSAVLKKGIQSQYTWQRFDVTGESLLTFATKRRQLAMIEVMTEVVEYDYKRLKTENLECINHQCEVAEAFRFNTIPSYQRKSLSEVYEDEGRDYLQKVAQDQLKDNKFSAETEKRLQEFKEKLLPKKPIQLADYKDIELYIIVVFKLILGGHKNDYEPTFTVFDRHLDIFAVHIIGLLQRLLPPDVADAYYSNRNELKYSHTCKKSMERACALEKRWDDQLKLHDTQPYYLSSEDAKKGLGIDTFVFRKPYFSSGVSQCALTNECTQATCELFLKQYHGASEGEVSGNELYEQRTKNLKKLVEKLKEVVASKLDTSHEESAEVVTPAPGCF